MIKSAGVVFFFILTTSECCVMWSHHSLRVTPAKAGWTAAGSGTDHAAPLRVAHGDVEEEEVVVLVASNPSSPLSPEKAHNQVPETRSQGWSL